MFQAVLLKFELTETPAIIISWGALKIRFKKQIDTIRYRREVLK